MEEYNELFNYHRNVKKWGITSRRIAILCEQGRIDGVVKKGKTWLIPCDAEKPEDARKTIIVNEVYWYAKG